MPARNPREPSDRMSQLRSLSEPQMSHNKCALSIYHMNLRSGRSTGALKLGRADGQQRTARSNDVGISISNPPSQIVSIIKKIAALINYLLHFLQLFAHC